MYINIFDCVHFMLKVIITQITLVRNKNDLYEKVELTPSVNSHAYALSYICVCVYVNCYVKKNAEFFESFSNLAVIMVNIGSNLRSILTLSFTSLYLSLSHSLSYYYILFMKLGTISRISLVTPSRL